MNEERTRARGRWLGLLVMLGVAGSPTLASAGKAIGTMTIAGVTSAPADVLQLTWASTNVTGAGAVTFAVVKPADASSPALFSAVMRGDNDLNAQVVIEGKGPLTTYDVEGLLVRAVETSSDAKGVVTETVTFEFRRFTVTVGGTSQCWDLVANMGC